MISIPDFILDYRSQEVFLRKEEHFGFESKPFSRGDISFSDHQELLATKRFLNRNALSAFTAAICDIEDRYQACISSVQQVLPVVFSDRENAFLLLFVFVSSLKLEVVSAR